MKYFVDPVKHALSKELFAFETEEDRDKYQPQASIEVAETPADYAPAKYKYNFETGAWEIEGSYVQNTELRRATRKREEALKLAIRQAAHSDMMGDAAKSAEWRQHYRDIYALDQDPNWPQVNWPVQPQE